MLNTEMTETLYRATCTFGRKVKKNAIVSLEPSERPGILNIVDDCGDVIATISRRNPNLFTLFEEVLDECEQPQYFGMWSYETPYPEESMRDDDDMPVRGVHRQHGSVVW